MKGFESFDIGSWTEDGLVIREQTRGLRSFARRAATTAAGFFASTVFAVAAAAGPVGEARSEVIVRSAVATNSLTLPVDSATASNAQHGASADSVGPNYWCDLMTTMKSWKTVEEDTTPLPHPIV